MFLQTLMVSGLISLKRNFVLATDWDFECFTTAIAALLAGDSHAAEDLGRKGGRVLYTDIAWSAFRALEQTGVSFERLMAEIHGRLPNGRLVVGMDVFRGLLRSGGVGICDGAHRVAEVESVL